MRRVKTIDDLKALLRRHEPEQLVTLEVDGRTVQVPAGTSVLEAADQADVWIPRLCHQPGAPIRAACRLCLVSIDGMNGLVNSCGTQVREGMVVRTTDPQINAVRQTVMELTMMEHGRCGRKDCEVEALASRLHALHGKLPKPVRPRPARRWSEYISFDASQCVLCDRCVRVCPLQVPQRAGRGGGITITFDGTHSPAESSCNACGDCVAVCPSGALQAPVEAPLLPTFKTRRCE